MSAFSWDSMLGQAESSPAVPSTAALTDSVGLGSTAGGLGLGGLIGGAGTFLTGLLGPVGAAAGMLGGASSMFGSAPDMSTTSASSSSGSKFGSIIYFDKLTQLMLVGGVVIIIWLLSRKGR